MNSLLTLSGLRFYRRHPAQLALTIVGVALGVAVVVAVDLASRNAERAFEYSRALVGAQATHVVEAVTGTLDERIYARLKLAGVRSAQPVIAGRVVIDGAEADVLGVDPIAALASSALDSALFESAATRPFVGSTTAVLLPVDGTAFATVQVPGRIAVEADGTTLELDVVGRHTAAPDTLLLDIAGAQRVLGLAGRLTRIELSPDTETLAEVRTMLPPGVVVRPASEVRDVTAEMLKAFRINLTALGLLSLVVGMLLIYATLSFSVVRRRRSIATLRALGVTQRQIVATILAEALLLGAVATLLGAALGWWLSTTLVDQVLATIGDLYFRAAVVERPLDAWPYAKGAVLGLGVSVIAALAPAAAAARRPPRLAMTRISEERWQGALVSRGPVVGLLLLTAAGFVLAWPGDTLVLGFVGLFLVLAGYAAASPALTAWLLDAATPLAARLGGLVALHALRGARRSLARTGVAVAALSVAVATVVGIGIMIASFRGSVTDWLDRSLLADFYLLSTATDSGGEATGFSSAELDELAALPGVTAISRSRTLTLRSVDGDVALRAAAPGPLGYGETVVAGPDDALERLAGGPVALASEPFAAGRGLQPGATITLPSPAGDVDIAIAGIYRDYRTSDNGLLMNYAVAEGLWGKLTPVGVGLYSDAADETLRDALKAFSERRSGTVFAANREIRSATLTVFDRTFDVTSVLRLLAATVAFFGILSALSALQFERRAEAATLRALGFKRRDVAQNSLWQSAMLGLTAGLLALPLGIALAGLLVVVINQRSYGWSMGFTVPPGELLAGVALALIAAFAAGIAPARRLAAQPIAPALRAD